jgi:hypothetical protein
MTVRSEALRFELRGGTGGPTTDALLGLWTASAADDDVLTFAAPLADTAAPEWRVWLRDGPGGAASDLSAAEARLDASQRALPNALARLHSFARQPGPPAGPAEAEVEALLHDLGQPQELAFGAAEQVDGRWERLVREFELFAERVAGALAPRSSVRTFVGQVDLGWTEVGWSGGLVSLQQSPLPTDARALHGRAVGLAMASRLTLLRTFILVARGAAVLGSAAVSPLGPVLALPAAWKLINDVQAEFRANHEMKRDQPGGRA